MSDRGFGYRLMALMAERGITFEELSDAMGVSVREIYYWTKGDRGVSFRHLRPLKAALGCTWDELLGE